MNARFDFEIVNRVVLDNRHGAFEGCETANQLKLLKEPFAIRARVAAFPPWREACSHGSIYLSALTLRIKESEVAC